MLCSLLGTHKNLGIKIDTGHNIVARDRNEKYKKKNTMHWAKNSSVARRDSDL